MSRAFVREDDQVQPGARPQPKMSSLPNWVTPRGLQMTKGKLHVPEKALVRKPDEGAAAWSRSDLRDRSRQRAGAEPVPRN